MLPPPPPSPSFCLTFLTIQLRCSPACRGPRLDKNCAMWAGAIRHFGGHSMVGLAEGAMWQAVQANRRAAVTAATGGDGEGDAEGVADGGAGVGADGGAGDAALRIEAAVRGQCGDGLTSDLTILWLSPVFTLEVVEEVHAAAAAKFRLNWLWEKSSPSLTSAVSASCALSSRSACAFSSRPFFLSSAACLALAALAAAASRASLRSPAISAVSASRSECVPPSAVLGTVFFLCFFPTALFAAFCSTESHRAASFSASSPVSSHSCRMGRVSASASKTSLPPKRR